MPRERALESHRRADIAGIYLLDLFAFVRVHFEEPANTLPGTLGRVVHIRPGFQRPGINPDERELAHEGIGHDLERYTRKGLAVRSIAHQFLTANRVDAFHRRNV